MGFSEKTKKKIFDKSRGNCENCKKQIVLKNHAQGQRGAWHAHHKTSEASGGRDVTSNGRALCLSCHKKTRTYGRH